MLKWLKRLTLCRPRHKVVTVTPTVWIPKTVLEQTVELLRESGTVTEVHEGVVYWAGRRFGARSIVTTCIAPAATTTPHSFETSSFTNARVVAHLASSDLELLGQVHSHPAATVDHSHGDDERALMPYEGFLSIVVPYYGRLGMTPLTCCGVHVFENGSFRRLARAEVESHFRVVDIFIDLRT